MNEPQNESSLTQESVERIAEGICQRGFGEVALFLFEAHRPLRGLGYHFSVFSLPFLTPFIGSSKTEELLAVLESEERFDALLASIQQKLR